MPRVTDPSIDLTFYPAAGGAPRGAVIVCPGGGYHGLAGHEGEPIAQWLNKAGFAAFVLRYRVSPNRHPAPLEDITRAVRLARAKAAEFRIKPDKIGILGFSAGGHLVTTLATHFDDGKPGAADPIDRASSRPDAVIPCYAVVSMEKFVHKGVVANLLGESPSEKTLRELSNQHHVTERTPPMFIWHTADDEAVPVEQCLLLAEALAKKKVPFELHIFPEGKHGLGLGDGSSFVGKSEAVAQWPRLCEAWLVSLGF